MTERRPLVLIAGAPAELPVSDVLTATPASYAPSVTPGSGSFTSASVAGVWFQLGKLVWVRVHVTITTNGTAAGFIDVSIPAPSKSIAGNNYQTLFGTESATGLGVRGAILNNSSICRITRAHDGAYPGGSGVVISINGWYEMA